MCVRGRRGALPPLAVSLMESYASMRDNEDLVFGAWVRAAAVADVGM